LTPNRPLICRIQSNINRVSNFPSMPGTLPRCLQSIEVLYASSNNFMNHRFLVRPSLLALTLFSMPLVLAPVVHAQSATRTSSTSERKAVTRALANELGRKTSGHPAIPSFKVTSLDIRSGWAKADVTPLGRDSGLDSVYVLMHKRGGRWAFVTLGTGLFGSGRQFHVPRSLWSRWGL